jgi:hypothetical protein
MEGIQVILYIYLTSIVVLITLYIKFRRYRLLISGITSILSSSTLAVGIVNYINTANNKAESDDKENRQNYIDFVSGSFDKIDGLYIDHPEQLHSLYYEFYGYGFFPQHFNNGDKNNNENADIKHDSNITAMEYITLIKIIQHLEIMYIANHSIFEDTTFRNRILNFTNSNKFRKTLAYNKNNFSHDFIEQLFDSRIIHRDQLDVEEISIPKIY